MGEIDGRPEPAARLGGGGAAPWYVVIKGDGFAEVFAPPGPRMVFVTRNAEDARFIVRAVNAQSAPDPVHAAEARVAALEKALLGLRSNVEAWRTGALDDTEALDRLCIIAANMPDPRMEANVQNGTSLAVNLFGHRWGKPYADGYATCPCGARENTPEAARQCPQSTGAALAETTEPPTP